MKNLENVFLEETDKGKLVFFFHDHQIQQGKPAGTNCGEPGTILSWHDAQHGSVFVTFKQGTALCNRRNLFFSKDGEFREVEPSPKES